MTRQRPASAAVRPQPRRRSKDDPTLEAVPEHAPDRSVEGSRALRFRAIGCEVLARPLYAAAALSRHTVDVVLLRRGLHDTPASLRQGLQAEIDATAASGTRYDATLLGYGLCGGATVGIVARDIPLVVPRAHDCITLFLGSRERYEREFAATPGTYWYSADYLERKDPIGDGGTGLFGVGAATDEELRAAYADYVRRFGPDNADYLMDTLGAWRDHYERAVYVHTGLGDQGHVEDRARAEAERRGWRFERLKGRMVLFKRLLDGDWAEDFLVLLPGERLAMRHDGAIVGPAES
jgi:Protein of unknown function (DUF1638)